MDKFGVKGSLDFICGFDTGHVVEFDTGGKLRQVRDLAQQGCKLIFTCSYGCMEQTLQVASEFPDVKFEHCTGFKRADNVSTYNSKFHEGRAVLGTIVVFFAITDHPTCWARCRCIPRACSRTSRSLLASPPWRLRTRADRQPAEHGAVRR